MKLPRLLPRVSAAEMTFSAKCFDQSQYIQIIGDTEISTNFVFFDISGTYNNNDFCLVRKLHQHL